MRLQPVVLLLGLFCRLLKSAVEAGKLLIELFTPFIQPVDADFERLGIRDRHVQSLLERLSDLPEFAQVGRLHLQRLLQGFTTTFQFVQPAFRIERDQLLQPIVQCRDAVGKRIGMPGIVHAGLLERLRKVGDLFEA